MGEIARDEVVREVKKTEDGHAGTPAPAPAKRRRRSGRARARTKPPQKAVRLTTYRRLAEYLEAFAKGHFHLMILVGDRRACQKPLGESRPWRQRLLDRGERHALWDVRQALPAPR